MSRAFLQVISTIVAYGDPTANDNPQRRYVDWRLATGAQSVADPICRGYTIEPGATLLLFDGTRTLLTGNDSEFDLEVVDSTTYRLRHTAGTNPVFRADRGLNLSAEEVTFAVNDNSTVTVTTTGSFAGVQVGDTVWIPDSDEEPTQPLHVSNRGFWNVLSASASTLVLERFDTFLAHSQADVTIAAAGEFVAFSAAGVQEGDSLDILDGFSSASRRVFPVLAVTPRYVEFQSSTPLAEQAGIIPSADGIAVYTNSKRFVYLESDQEIAVRANGDTGDSQRVAPMGAAGDTSKPGCYQRTGPTWALSVVSRSTQPANVTLIAAE